MNSKQMLESILHAVSTIKDAWPVKLAASFLLAFFTSQVGTILMIFFALVFVDLFTRWLALAKAYLLTEQKNNTTLFNCFLHIKKARAAGYIQSDIMKHRFAGKFLWYTVMCFLAFLLDANFQAFGDNGGFIKLFVIYMGISEGISVLENLHEAGVKEASGLLEIIKNRRNALK